jgi:hypothetical protein
METKMKFTKEKAKEIGRKIGIDWARAKFDVDQFCMGLGVELEHGKRDPRTNVTNDDFETTGKIAWAHLCEIPDYYSWLTKMEKEAESCWEKKNPSKKQG